MDDDRRDCRAALRFLRKLRRTRLTGVGPTPLDGPVPPRRSTLASFAGSGASGMTLKPSTRS
jgi:hypothetical protein